MLLCFVFAATTETYGFAIADWIVFGSTVSLCLGVGKFKVHILKYWNRIDKHAMYFQSRIVISGV